MEPRTLFDKIWDAHIVRRETATPKTTNTNKNKPSATSATNNPPFLTENLPFFWEKER